MMVFIVIEMGSDMWLVTNAAAPSSGTLMDARFTGDAARDRAYAYMHWMNDSQMVNRRIDELKAELDRAIDDLRNLRDQLLPAVQ